MSIYQSTYPTDQFGNRFVQNDMGKYIETRPEVPDDIKDRKAYFVGSGIGNLIAAGYLLRDGQMPGENITFLEQLEVAGGSFDGAGSNQGGSLLAVAVKWGSTLSASGTS